MKEIKFRFWDATKKTMGKHTWSLDDLAYEGYTVPYTDENGEHSRDYEVVPLQFTGLTDGQGKEIYEGDIVDFTYWWFDGSEQESHLIGEVIYLPEQMSFGLKGVRNRDWLRHIGAPEDSTDTAPFATWTFADADFTVLGNIYQNPELLENPETK